MKFKDYLNEKRKSPSGGEGDEESFKDALKSTMWDFAGKAFSDLKTGATTMWSPGKNHPTGYLKFQPSYSTTLEKAKKQLLKYASDNSFIKYFFDNADKKKSKDGYDILVLSLDSADKENKAAVSKATAGKQLMPR